MQDIKVYNTFTKIEPVNKGWSSDKKYYIETEDGRKLLLRVADISEYDKKRQNMISNTLSSIYWAIPFGENEVVTMKNQARDVLSWFDNMSNPVPIWYLENYR